MEDFFFEDNAEVPAAEFEAKVPSDYRFGYVKDGEVYKLSGDANITAAIKMLDGRGKTIKTVKSTNQAVGLESKNRREQLEKWTAETGFADPETAKAAIADLNAKLASKASIKPEEVRAAIEKEYTDKLAEAEGKVKTMFGTLEKHLRDKDALAALAEHKGNAKLLMPVILAQTKVVQGDDGEYFTAVLNAKGEIRAGSDGGPLPISKFVAELKEDKEYAAAFEATQSKGGGTTPNNNRQQQQQQTPNTQQRQDGAGRGIAKITAGLAGR